jgi:hypothetical protein
MALLRSLAAEKCEAHRRRFLGRTLSAITLITPPALAEQKRTSALTENFLPVEIDATLPANQLVRLRVTSLGQNSVLNSVLDSVLEAHPVA